MKSEFKINRTLNSTIGKKMISGLRNEMHGQVPYIHYILTDSDEVVYRVTRSAQEILKPVNENRFSYDFHCQQVKYSEHKDNQTPFRSNPAIVQTIYYPLINKVKYIAEDEHTQKIAALTTQVAQLSTQLREAIQNLSQSNSQIQQLIQDNEKLRQQIAKQNVVNQNETQGTSIQI
jgi:hypothetical protein